MKWKRCWVVGNGEALQGKMMMPLLIEPWPWVAGQENKWTTAWLQFPAFSFWVCVIVIRLFMANLNEVMAVDGPFSSARLNYQIVAVNSNCCCCSYFNCLVCLCPDRQRSVSSLWPINTSMHWPAVKSPLITIPLAAHTHSTLMTLPMVITLINFWY